MIVTRDNLKRLGPILRKRRIKSGVKQYVMAGQIGYTTSNLCEFEHGKVTPKITMLLDLCDQLGLELVLREKRA